MQEAENLADQIHEALEQGRRPRDFAVFYRTNALSRGIEEALVKRGIPYQIVNGHEFYQRREVKDMLAYLHLLNNPRHDAAFRRVINTPPRGIGKTTIERLTEHARRRRISMLEAAREAGLMESLNKRAATALTRFVSLYDQLHAAVQQSVQELARRVLYESGYRERLAASESEEDQERLANVEELIAAAREFDGQHPEDGGLEAFLEQASLVADTDNWEAAVDKVSLMTLHAAKGLEFPVVFIVAMEEGLLPHERSRHDPEKLEEERRLLFVGVTRAEERLQLSMARRRALHGDFRPTVPSTFLMELPREEIELIECETEWATRRRGARALEDQWQDEFDDANRQDEHEDVHECPPDDVSDIAGQPDEAGDWAADATGLPADEPLDDPTLDDPTLDETATARSPRRSPRRARRPTAASAPPSIRTAAEMLGDSTSAVRHAVDDFELGMLVRHPLYGPGRIVDLAGSGRKRTAAVDFFGDAGRRKFRLAFTPLEPIASPS